MASSKPTNHKLHILISLVTFGLWLPIYFIVAIKNRGANSDSAVEVKEKSKWQKIAEEANTISAQNPGYKKPRGRNSPHIVYVLACNHQIRSVSEGVFGFKHGRLNKRVWCEVCSAEREVTDFVRI